MKFTPSRALRLAVCTGFGLAVVAAYAALNGIYRPENGDDAWSLSFLHNYLHRGVECDITFGTADGSGGQNGTELFGKLQAFVYGPILDRTGWARRSAHLVSLALMVAAAAAWGMIAAMAVGGKAPLKEPGGNGAGEAGEEDVHVGGARSERVTVALLTALFVLLIEPFFGAANQARPDALAFLFCTLSLLALLRSFPVAAGLLSVAAFETHPMGAVVAFYLLAALAARHAGPPVRWKGAGREVLGLALGGALGLTGYCFLHLDCLHKLPSVLFGNNEDAGGGYLVSYFLRTRYLRHLPELALFVVCAAVFIGMRGWRWCPLAAWMTVSVLLSTIMLRRPNFHYAIYPYPSFVLLAVCVFHRGKRLWVLAILLAALLLPQYALAWRMNRGFSFDRFVVGIRSAVPDDGLPVVGNPNSWFAMRDRAFYAVEYSPGSFRALGLDSFYLVENGAFREEQRYAALNGAIRAGYNLTPLSAFREGRDEFRIFKCSRKAENREAVISPG